MANLLVLIAAPGSGAIDAAVISAMCALARSDPSWLAPAEAVEFPLDRPIGETAIVETLAGKPIDIAVIPAADRRKRLLLADMDSTMIGQECIDELGQLAGFGARIREITARTMRGELDFEAALKERVGLMAGLPRTAIAQVLAERITFTPGGRALVQTMRAHGAHTALVSGGFVEFTEHVSARLGFDEHRANALLWHGAALSGEVREPILGREAKLAALHQLVARFHITARQVLAVGDGANDIPMLAAAGMGVALHAKPTVRAAAPLRIDHGDLTALLYLQGYRREEFIGDDQSA